MKKLSMLLLGMLAFECSGGEKLYSETELLSPIDQLVLHHPLLFNYHVMHPSDDLLQPKICLQTAKPSEFTTNAVLMITRLSFRLTVRGSVGDKTLKQSELDRVVRDAAFTLQENVIDDNSIHHLQLADGLGSYWSFEDPDVALSVEPLPGDYDWVTVGVFQLGEYLFTFSGVSRAVDDADYTDALRILEGLTISRVVTNKADAALLQAAYVGDLDEVNAALSEGANIDATDPRGWTPLIYGIKERHVDVALRLIAQGADVNQRTTTEHGSTVLCFAVQANHPDILAAVLKKGADVNQASRDGLRPLTYAAEYGLTGAARILISQGAEVDYLWRREHPDHSMTPLMAASAYGRVEIMDLLVRSGAKLEMTNEVGETALMFAAGCPRPGPVAWLIEHKARVDAKGIYGQTALHSAAARGHVENLKLLLDAGADPFATVVNPENPDCNRCPSRPEEFAREKGHMEAMRVILAAQARYAKLRI